MVEAVGLVKRFGKTTALDGVSLAVEEGTVLGLLGPNGAGKSTIVRVLTTLLRPDAGVARVAGLDVVAHGEQVRSLIGLAGQYAAVDDLLTGRENLELVGLWYHLSRREYRRRAQDTVERLSLASAADRLVKTYSGGMRRRLDLGASLVGEAPVVFLDEPTTGLDPRTRNELWQLVRERADRGATVLLTTQYMEEAEQLADKIVVIDKGAKIAEGTPDELKEAIGGLTLDVRVGAPGDLDGAAGVLEALSGGQATRDPEARRVSVAAGGGIPMLLEAGARLQAAGIALDDLGIRRPSLDEVFLALTAVPGQQPSAPPTDGEATI